jgi:hypothetical protein
MPKRDGQPFTGQQFLTVSPKVTRLVSERASFLKMNDINDISFFGTPTAIIVVP